MKRHARCQVVALVLLAIGWLGGSPAAAQPWVVLYDHNSHAARNLPPEALQKLDALAKQGVRLKSISFAPRGSWAILHDQSGLSALDIPEAALEKLQALAARGAALKSVAFSSNGGWVILHDKQGVASAGIPEAAANKLHELAAGGSDLTSITFNAASGWVIMYGKNGVAAAGIPAEALSKLHELARQGSELKSIAFAPGGGWVILFDTNGLFARGIPDDAFKELVELGRRGATLKSVAFVPRPPLQLSHEDAATRRAILARLAHHKVPGISIALIQDGRLQWARGFGVVRSGEEKPVTAETLFQAASVSKPVTALATLRLAEQHKLDLDRAVNQELVSWHVPDNEFTQEAKPTVRRILSHSAGFNVHGFGGYAAGTRLPTLVQVLNGKKPANSPAIRVVYVPGTKMQYSGGGYTVLQQLLVDVTKTAFPKLMQEEVLGPLGMDHSTFALPLPKAREGDAAVAHDSAGHPLAGNWRLHPEMAAAGLWTTPSDLARFVLALSSAYRDEAGAILTPDMAHAMFTRQVGGFGLGVGLGGKDRSFSFSHNGSNAGYRCLFIGFPETGQGAVLMTNSDNGAEAIAEFHHDLRIEYAWPK